MTVQSQAPRALSIFDLPSGFYSAMIQQYLDQVVALDDPSRLPQLRWVINERGDLSIFLLCFSRPNVGKFFYEMITRWLLPGKKLNISLFFTTDFRIPEWEGEKIFTLSHLVIRPHSEEEKEIILNQLFMIEHEIRLGAQSVYHASRILEVKGLSADEKASLIQDRIARFVRKRPLDFEYDVFGEMQHFFVHSRSPFKTIREFEHLTKMICLFYLFRKDLSQEIEEAAEKRHVRLKLFPVRLHMPLGVKKALGVCVGLNLLNENEMFEERHLFKALQNCFPAARLIDNSFFIHAAREDEVLTLYLEIEAEEGKLLDPSTIRKLEKELPDAVKACVEQRMRPLFMPRNEEEVMRNILTLSNQLKYLRDIPHVILTFEEQKEGELLFTVILLRVLEPEAPSIQELFHPEKTRLVFHPERIKKMGFIRKKYPKEASVLRVNLSANEFIRADHTVDLYKARQRVIAELEAVLGEVRDYNGGMISKQIEAFISLKNSLGPLGTQNEFLLENFFHSISPVEMRSLLPTQPLINLFLMLLNLVEHRREEKEKVFSHYQTDASFAYLFFGISDLNIKQKIQEKEEKLRNTFPKIVSITIKILDVFYLGYLLLSEDAGQKNLFIETMAQDP